MDNDQIWGVIVIMGIIGIILALYGGYTLMEMTETSYDKCVDSCNFYIGDNRYDVQLEAECVSNCSVLEDCGVTP